MKDATINGLASYHTAFIKEISMKQKTDCFSRNFLRETT